MEVLEKYRTKDYIISKLDHTISDSEGIEKKLIFILVGIAEKILVLENKDKNTENVEINFYTNDQNDLTEVKDSSLIEKGMELLSEYDTRFNLGIMN
ncbi:hypothetical protein Bp8pS_073 [Bacillus phage vB_BpuM-BpSp]|nr:hypothetical protein Bp8pS_073 [Bacillus phage vB_BpuM-BpSp]